MDDDGFKISIIMPAFNEGDHIDSNLRETISYLKEIDVDYEIIVVDDGSKDNTFIEIEGVANGNDKVRALKLGSNQGKGFALKHGCGHITGDVTIFYDADLDIPPFELINLLNKFLDEDTDVLIGSKRHPESELDYPWHRKLASDVYAILLTILFRLPLRDTQTGLKIFKTEVLRRVYPKILCKRFAYDVEILANANKLGYKIKESPVKITFRRERRWGRVTYKDVIKTTLDTLAVFYRMYILRYYDDIDVESREEDITVGEVEGSAL